MADVVRQDNEVTPHVERLPRSIKLAGELRGQELFPRPARAVQDQHRVGHRPGSVAPGRSQGHVMQLQRRQALAGAEVKVADDEFALVRSVGRRGLDRLGASLGGQRQA